MENDCITYWPVPKSTFKWFCLRDTREEVQFRFGPCNEIDIYTKAEDSVIWMASL